MREFLVLWSFAATLARAAAPSLAEIRVGYARSELAFLDRQGELLQELRDDRTARRLDWMPLAELSPALRQAVIFAEDRRFERHGGVDWLALGAAAWENLIGEGRRGASTITMQLAGLLDEEIRSRSRGRSFSQKWDQIRAAREIEATWTKDEIFEAYLNLVSWRGELQGIAAASQGLFGKQAHGLDLSEARLLAALLRAPNASPEKVAARACLLARSQEKEADCEGLHALARERLGKRFDLGYRAFDAPHAARRALAWRPEGARERRLTIDGGLQRFALATLQEQLTQLEKRGVRDGAVLVVDNESGDVLAYVGNGGPNASSAFHVDGVQARRQAGSTLKPFLYGLAFEKRLLKPETLLQDAPVDIPVAGGVYHPTNYDHSFHGPVSVSVALGSSLNVPAVRALLLVGVDPFRDLLERAGFTELREPEYYGPSLALGAVDVSLWDLVGAYRMLAREGLHADFKIDPEQPLSLETRVFSARTARLVTSVLSAPENRALGFGFDSALNTRAGAAVKTGTSKDMRDNWCVGYTKRYTVGVWIGNFNGDPMRDVSGVTGAGPVWAAVMDSLQPSAAGFAHSRIQSSPQAAVVPWGAPAARILYPASGTVIAIDPDMPAGVQRVLFEASESSAVSRWRLNGEVLAGERKQLVWEPRPGRHKLALIGAGEHVLDEVEFIVR